METTEVPVFMISVYSDHGSRKILDLGFEEIPR